ncbi:hypothetical protein QZH41_000897 [Actinostola sp. cb2023]|nr:hypothetical protein QZH41_000897 [Actinostola sp. cb2023]
MNNTTSNATQDNGSLCPAPVIGTSTERWIKTTACIIVLVVSVLANTFIIFIVNKKQRIKTVTNCLVANMASSDLLIGLINMPNIIKEEVTDSLAMPFGGFAGEFLCKILVISQDISAFCSILSLIAITVERYFAIFMPFKKYFTLGNVKYIIIACWVVSFIVSSPLLYANKVDIFEGEYQCNEDWSPLDGYTASKTYTLITFVLLYAVPLVTICSLYAAVVHRLWHQAIPGDQRTPQSRKYRSRSKKRVLKMLIAIVLAFALCWLPYHVYYLLDGFYPPYKACGAPFQLYFASKFLAYANSAISPCIFIFFDKGVSRYISNKINPCCEGLTKTNAALMNRKRSALYSSNSDPDPTQTNGIVRLKSYRIYGGGEPCHNGVIGDQEIRLTRFETPDLIAGHENIAFKKDHVTVPKKNIRTVSFAQ